MFVCFFKLRFMNSFVLLLLLLFPLKSASILISFSHLTVIWMTVHELCYKFSRFLSLMPTDDLFFFFFSVDYAKGLWIWYCNRSWSHHKIAVHKFGFTTFTVNGAKGFTILILVLAILSITPLLLFVYSWDVKNADCAVTLELNRKKKNFQLEVRPTIPPMSGFRYQKLLRKHLCFSAAACCSHLDWP